MFICLHLELSRQHVVDVYHSCVQLLKLKSAHICVFVGITVEVHSREGFVDLCRPHLDMQSCKLIHLGA